MYNARNIAQWVLIIAAVLILLWLLTGCEGTRSTKNDDGRVIIEADCDENTLDIEFQIEQSGDRKQIEVTKP